MSSQFLLVTSRSFVPSLIILKFLAKELKKLEKDGFFHQDKLVKAQLLAYKKELQPGKPENMELKELQRGKLGNMEPKELRPGKPGNMELNEL